MMYGGSQNSSSWVYYSACLAWKLYCTVLAFSDKPWRYEADMTEPLTDTTQSLCDMVFLIKSWSMMTYKLSALVARDVVAAVSVLSCVVLVTPFSLATGVSSFCFHLHNLYLPRHSLRCCLCCRGVISFTISHLCDWISALYFVFFFTKYSASLHGYASLFMRYIHWHLN